MNYALSLTLVLGTATLAAARCENNCNGNGECGQHDKCYCFEGFTGVGCADRVCAHGFSWIGDHKLYAECSSKGTCDRKSGTCKCQDGFEGVSCNRMDCPNDCSGHGRCRTNAFFSGTSSADWDQNMIQGCICDAGYTGLSCESQLCPRGDDPMTDSVSDPNQIQRLSFSHASAIAGEVSFSFTDTGRGQTYTTWSLDVSTLSATALKEAFEALPDKVIPSLTVSAGTANSVTAATFDIEFSDAHNSGTQNTIMVNTGACIDHGCHPVSAGLSSTTASITVQTQSTAENAICSNRGSCDASSGLCQCAEGYTGLACETQTIYV